jgi:hypothetical protein
MRRGCHRAVHRNVSEVRTDFVLGKKVGVLRPWNSVNFCIRWVLPLDLQAQTSLENVVACLV